MKPTVTDLINMLNKPSLISWANKIGLDGICIEEYRRKTLNAGLSLHRQIDRFFKTGECLDSEDDNKRLINFIKNKKILSTEVDIQTEYFVGRYDVKLEYNGLLYLCDFKTNKKKVYFENKLQLIAYNMAEKCNKLAIISIPSFKLIEIEIDIENMKRYENIIILLSQIYKERAALNE